MVQAYKIVALAIAFASFGGVSAWQTQNWRYGLQIANIEAKASNDKLDALNAEIAKREEMENRKDEAIRNAESRAVENKAMADRSSSSIASLRKQLSSAESTYSKATDEARARHFSIVQGVVESCTAEYQRLGIEAASIASDLELMKDAWPQ